MDSAASLCCSCQGGSLTGNLDVNDGSINSSITDYIDIEKNFRERVSIMKIIELLRMITIVMLLGIACPLQAYPADFIFKDDTLIGGNFQSHNQKVVYTANGIFRTAEGGRVYHSTDGGSSFNMIYNANITDLRSPTIEADEDNNVYVIYPEGEYRRTRFLKFSPSNDYAAPVVNKAHTQAFSAAKFASFYDPTRSVIYHVTQWGYLFTFDMDGNFVRGKQLFTDGSTGSAPSYPHLFVDVDGIIHYGLTTHDAAGAIPYETIRYLKSLDGGITWKKMDGTTVSTPASSDPDSTGSTRINPANKTAYTTWLANMHAKNGKVHFVWYVRNCEGQPTITQYMHYKRYDIDTGICDVDSSPNGTAGGDPQWKGQDLALMNYSAAFASNPDTQGGPLLVVGHEGIQRLIALISYDDGQTWNDYAYSRWFSQCYDVGLARAITALRMAIVQPAGVRTPLTPGFQTSFRCRLRAAAENYGAGKDSFMKAAYGYRQW